MADDLTPEAQRDLAAMNACTYAMTPADRTAWYAAHPLSMYQPEPAVLTLDETPESDAAILRAAADILRRRFGVLNCHNERLVLTAAAQRIESAESPV
jgi:hypothetical protein